MAQVVAIGGGVLLAYVLVVLGISIENATNTDGVTLFLVGCVACISLARSFSPKLKFPTKKKVETPPVTVVKKTTEVVE